ncbi:hypothetical protein HJC23_004813 [Cyclotella cryptica]|uniref:Centrosomal protein of 19 kDa n=1 Tax=Cyclotella cryptica TaxID=29204 RepID=A0ABD3PY37_9STRA
MTSISKVIVTKVAVSYHPPMFKFEYTKGRRNLKYHKNVNLATRTFIQPNMSEFVADLGFDGGGRKNVVAAVAAKRIAEFSGEITIALMGRYSELLQVPPPKIENLIKKLLAVNPMLIDNSVETSQIDNNADEQAQLNISVRTDPLSASPHRVRPKLQRRNGVRNMINRSLSASSSITDDDLNDERMLEPQLASSQAKEKLSEFGDLNKASEDDLRLAKNQMNEVFEKLRLLPGDEEYVYDKRVNFEEPDEESSWD